MGHKPAAAAKTRRRAKNAPKIGVAVVLLVVLTFCTVDLRPSPFDTAAAGFGLNVVQWELAHLPGKWWHRLARVPSAWTGGSSPTESLQAVEEFFAANDRMHSIDNRLIYLSGPDGIAPEHRSEAQSLTAEWKSLQRRVDHLRPRVEETLESAVAQALRAQDFGSILGVFPPVDAVLVASPTVLVTSPKDRIERGEERLLQTGLTAEERSSIESRLESSTGLSALVVDTGGIAFYPAISVPHAGVDFVLEIIAHEWVHHWLWFRPLGRRYFQDGDLRTLNETVASVVGRELGAAAKGNLGTAGPITLPPETGAVDTDPATRVHPSAVQFDFQAEMRATRIRVDDMLAAGKVDEAEAYMEERRQVFVMNGYPIRRLNQAYFAFHGSYATTGAAGVNIIGEQVQELRRRSTSLAQFLRIAARFTSPQDLTDFLHHAQPR